MGDRTQASCLITSGDLPITITWLKDNRTLTGDGPHLETVGGEFYSNLVFKHLRADQAGLYTCQAANRAAVTRHSASLAVRGQCQAGLYTCQGGLCTCHVEPYIC